ncbi:30S ribosomal protein S8 [Candidatus Peregrinibacteria bacterium CG_4_10_14_0_2_um_filter_38_24]|nr:MAG: 30S ribosomal protein S8 [Candidatus Peregrinibacteria bacterium CG_4_10_14_0_2_um_filter_38_24]PJC38623.1 MAG: 30S ribosomal protein S8 [Candidatus Peregrinibacteria bacterium CG_4_9_14_0_2_um_filter_38_9]
MNTDPIADLLTRIRNALNAHHETTIVPHSKIKESILRILKDKKFIEGYEEKEEGGMKVLEVQLKEDMTNRLTLKRLSKPGQRIYVKTDEIHPIKSGLGIQIISTSKGLMDGASARKQKLGGELICEVY